MSEGNRSNLRLAFYVVCFAIAPAIITALLIDSLAAGRLQEFSPGIGFCTFFFLFGATVACWRMANKPKSKD